MPRRGKRTTLPNNKRRQGSWNQEQRRRRRALDQNFLQDRRLARRIVAESSVGKDDLVVEFGAGGGMLTDELSKAARRVLAVELDPLWTRRLRGRFSGHENVRVVQGDALAMGLPDEPFMVVANIPFNATTPILHRLLDDPGSPLKSASLVVQKQVALKHARSTPTTLKTLNWSPWYTFTAGPELPANAFYPKPRVDACLMLATKGGPPLVDPCQRHLFRSFVRRAFGAHPNAVGKSLRTTFTRTQLRRLARDNGFSLDLPPSTLTVRQWVMLFEFAIRTTPGGSPLLCRRTMRKGRG